MLASIQNRRAALPPQTANFATLASTARIYPLLRAPDVLQARFRLLKDPRLPTAAFFVWQANILQSMLRQLALIVQWAHTPPLWDRCLLHRVSSADLASTYLQRAQIRRASVKSVMQVSTQEPRVHPRLRHVSNVILASIRRLREHLRVQTVPHVRKYQARVCPALLAHTCP